MILRSCLPVHHQKARDAFLGVDFEAVVPDFDVQYLATDITAPAKSALLFPPLWPSALLGDLCDKASAKALHSGLQAGAGRGGVSHSLNTQITDKRRGPQSESGRRAGQALMNRDEVTTTNQDQRPQPSGPFNPDCLLESLSTPPRQNNALPNRSTPHGSIPRPTRPAWR